MFRVCYDSKTSLEALERHLNGMMDSQKCSVAKNVVGAGLMRATHPLLMLTKMINKTAYGVAWRQVITKNPKVGLDVWKDTMRHMVKGKDQFDKNSAGGFSKGELEMLASFVRMAGFATFEVWTLAERELYDAVKENKVEIASPALEAIGTSTGPAAILNSYVQGKSTSSATVTKH